MLYPLYKGETSTIRIEYQDVKQKEREWLTHALCNLVIGCLVTNKGKTEWI